MSCSHATGCPLFPLLNASLQGWRDFYCDSREERWRDCARYKLSLTSTRVPISLLPNGHHAQHLKRDADADSCGAAGPRQASQSRPDPVPETRDRLAGRTRQGTPSKRGLSARISDWMRGSA